jgi:hypothetical protein
MIHTTENFFNKVSDEIMSKYFSNVNFYRDDEKCVKAKYSLELFNNGCINYRQLIGRLAKACNDSTTNIHNIVSKYILSFGCYRYRPKRA